jgi:hypothetical protein
VWVGEKAAPSGPYTSPFSSAGASARVRAARFRGLSCRIACTRSQSALFAAPLDLSRPCLYLICGAGMV